MAALTVQKTALTGLNPAYAAAAGGGDTVANDGKTFLHVKNGHTSAQTVTVDSKVACSQGTDHDVAVSVPNGGERMIGPFDAARFNNASGALDITYSGVTALTIAAVSTG